VVHELLLIIPHGLRIGSKSSLRLCDTSSMNNSNEAKRVLDVKGLKCPMPLLKAKLALNEMVAGELLEVFATDSGSMRDFAVFSKQSGHQLLESIEVNGVYTYLLQKKAG